MGDLLQRALTKRPNPDGKPRRASAVALWALLAIAVLLCAAMLRKASRA